MSKKYNRLNGLFLCSKRNLREDIKASIIKKEDKIFYFPSWLEHEVDVNNSDEERISISFNIIRKNDCDWKMYLLCRNIHSFLLECGQINCG